MKAEQISQAVQEAQLVGDTILDTLKVVDPKEAVPAEVAETVVDLLGKMLPGLLQAYAGAAGTPITAVSVQALLPNPEPLTAPEVETDENATPRQGG